MNGVQHRISRSVLFRYALGVVAVAIAFALAHLVHTSIPGVFVFLFLAAILIGARLGAKGPAVLTFLLSSMAVAWLLPPENTLAIDRAGLPLFFGFLGCALLLSWLSME